MKCRICAGVMQAKRTDLPFKIGENTIVIVKELPVILCPQCGEYVISDPVMDRIEGLLASVDKSTELEIVRYAA